MARVYRKKLEEAIFKLLDSARILGASVVFKDPDVCEEVWPDCAGRFDCTTNQITIYKRKEKPLNVYHIFTLAHEVRHAWQFANKYQPMQWLVTLGVYPSYKNSQQEQTLEDDADAWAKEFMIKNKIPPPPVEEIFAGKI